VKDSLNLEKRCFLSYNIDFFKLNSLKENLIHNILFLFVSHHKHLFSQKVASLNWFDFWPFNTSTKIIIKILQFLKVNWVGNCFLWKECEACIYFSPGWNFDSHLSVYSNKLQLHLQNVLKVQRKIYLNAFYCSKSYALHNKKIFSKFVLDWQIFHKEKILKREPQINVFFSWPLTSDLPFSNDLPKKIRDFKLNLLPPKPRAISFCVRKISLLRSCKEQSDRY